MLQAFLVVPAFGPRLPGRPRRTRCGARIVQLGRGRRGSGRRRRAGGWRSSQLTPAADRPYIGGSQDNSLLNLIFGYNGFGRLTGNESGSVGGGGGTAAQWGPTGWMRLFNADFGGQISWLLPAALILLAAVLWLHPARAAHRPHPRRASLLWGGWLVVTGADVQLRARASSTPTTPSPGAGDRRARRHRRRARCGSGGAQVAARVDAGRGRSPPPPCWAWVLLDRTPSWQPVAARAHRSSPALGCGRDASIAAPWLAPAAERGDRRRRRSPSRWPAGPAAYTLDTVATAHAGAIPSAGPVERRRRLRPGAAERRRSAARRCTRSAATAGAVVPARRHRPAAGGLRRRRGRDPRRPAPEHGTPRARLTEAAEGRRRRVHAGSRRPSGSNERGRLPARQRQAGHGHRRVQRHRPGAHAGQFERYVRRRRDPLLHRRRRWAAAGQGSDATAITAWVRSHFTATAVGGTTLYDLSSGRS